MAHPGFIGSAFIITHDTSSGWPAPGGGTGTIAMAGGGLAMYLSGGSLNPVQEITAPELVQGQIVKHIAYMGKVEVGGNVQAPIDEFHKSIFDSAWYRAGDGSGSGGTGSVPGGAYPDRMADEQIIVKLSYYRTGAKNARVFNNLAINTYEISVTAGDVATFTADFMGASNFDGTNLKNALSTEHFNSPAPCAKLVTWDRCRFSLTGINIAVQSFTFSVNNNLTRVYKVRSANVTAQDHDPASTLYPVELVAGFRDVTGSVTALMGDAGTGDTIVDGAPEEEFQPAGWTNPGGLVEDDGAGTNPGSFKKFGAENWSTYEINNIKVPVVFEVGEGLPTPIINQTFNAVFKRPEASVQTGLATVNLSYVGLCYDELAP